MKTIMMGTLLYLFPKDSSNSVLVINECLYEKRIDNVHMIYKYRNEKYILNQDTSLIANIPGHWGIIKEN